MTRKALPFNDLAQLGKRLEICREKMKLKKTDAGRLVGVSSQSVDNWEEGRSEPPLAYLAYLAETYGYDLNWLILGISQPLVVAGESSGELELLRENRALRKEVEELKRGGPGLSVARPALGAELAEE